MKKTAIILTLALLLVSCSDNTPTVDESLSEQSTAEISELSSEYGYVAPDIPSDVNYGGKEFCIAYPEWSSYKTYFWADSQNGETVNDACWKRLTDTEEKLGVDITCYPFGVENDTLKFVEQTVMSGSGEYDLLMTHNYVGLLGILSGGYVKNWNDISSIDLTKPYYNQNVNDNLEIDGFLPFLSSDFILPDVNGIFFNIDMVESYKLENPYALVKSGKWTLDRLEEMSKAVTSDIDGNSQFDINDQYGFSACGGWQLVSAITSGGQLMVEHEGDSLRIAIKDERCVNIVEKLQKFLFESGDAYVWKSLREYDPNNGGTPPVNFADGRVLFYGAPLSYFPFLRESQVEYGVLPFPKYDEQQEGYNSLNWAGYMAILQTAEDPVMTGYVVEVLSSESCRTVHPAFYNELLSGKIARDPDAVETLDIMFNNTVSDLGIITSVFKMISGVLVPGSSSAYVSAVDSQITSYTQYIDQYIEGCRELKSKAE